MADVRARRRDYLLANLRQFVRSSRVSPNDHLGRTNTGINPDLLQLNVY